MLRNHKRMDSMSSDSSSSSDDNDFDQYFIENDVIVTVVPTDDENMMIRGSKPFSIKVPKKIRTMNGLYKYLQETNIFRRNRDNYNEKINLGVYWRITKDYKTDQSPAIIYRRARGSEFKRNKLLDKWKENPNKPTWGPVVILKIQKGDWEFSFGGYTIDDYYNQCQFNIKYR